MVETVQIAVTADTSDAGASFKELTSQIAAVRAPLAALGTASAQALQVQQGVVQDMVQQALQATRSMQQSDAAYVDAFKNGMQVLVDHRVVHAVTIFSVRARGCLHDDGDELEHGENRPPARVVGRSRFEGLGFGG